MTVYSNTVYLNANGWSLDSNPTTSNLLGIWSDRRDEIAVNTLDPYGIFITSGVTANTLAGSDSIIGIAQNSGIRDGILNFGTINTAEGNDTITGTGIDPNRISMGIYNEGGTINTGKGNDVITGTGSFIGIFNQLIFGGGAVIDTGEGNDIIVGSGAQGIDNQGTINTVEGNDTINASGTDNGIRNSGTINTSINTGKGNDTINASGFFTGIENGGTINTGQGNDIITATSTFTGFAAGILNSGTINTDQGDDTITATGVNTSIGNEGGTINTAEGNDTIIAKGKFSGDGSVFLGSGNDKLSGFGTGKFYGGCGKDTLILPSDHYTIGSATIGGETFVTFTQGGITMNTREFESLIVGSSQYNFASLTPGSIVS